MGEKEQTQLNQQHYFFPGKKADEKQTLLMLIIVLLAFVQSCNVMISLLCEKGSISGKKA